MVTSKFTNVQFSSPAKPDVLLSPPAPSVILTRNSYKKTEERRICAKHRRQEATLLVYPWRVKKISFKKLTR